MVCLFWYFELWSRIVKLDFEVGEFLFLFAVDFNLAGTDPVE